MGGAISLTMTANRPKRQVKGKGEQEGMDEYLTDDQRDDVKQIAEATSKMNADARGLVLKFARDILLFGSYGYELRKLSNSSV